MKGTIMKRRSLLMATCGALALVLGLAGALWAGGNATNQTAQSVMFATQMNGDFIITDTQTWAFQPTVAATYFTNSWDGTVPTGQIVGKPSGYTTAPPAPAPPAPIDSKLNGSVHGNRCTFLHGGTLTLLGDLNYSQYLTKDAPYSYYDSKKNKTISGTDTYKYIYNYTITVNAPGTVNPLTAWQMVSDTPGGTRARLT